ncbi:type I secretion system permease/ATPase [Salinisphaera sp. G21_0]|uniref:type I secretion system permease/ATPase n=1 Tax=Salinisphaera sp. G21_0 TaxID=2821094 RepID=UPI001ADB9517|nr:type I secretion system permease/ATPase [Salinisphaera sp. G21_0]MBO9481164.1 type I secretion system permease/ATPase [Salinisphaera sp. G21_0]
MIFLSLAENGGGGISTLGSVLLKQNLSLDEVAMAQSPLLTSLIWIARFYGIRVIAESVLTGLPVQPDEFADEYLERAAGNAGLTLFTRPLVSHGSLEENCPPSCLPCIVWLSQSPIVVVQITKEYVELRQPKHGMAAERLHPDDFLQNIDNRMVFFSRARVEDDRDPDYPPDWRDHWFWGSLLESRRIYREVLLASLLVNVFALAVPLFVRLIYDRVIPGMALTTLNTLTTGVVVVIFFELICRQLRTRFIDIAAKKSDLLMSSQLFAKIMRIRMSFIPAAVGSFTRQIQDFEAIREFITSTTLTAMVDLPFAILFLVVIGLMGGQLVWIPLIVIVSMSFISAAVQPRLRQSIEESERLSARKHGDLVESITGLESLRLAGAQSRFQQRWEQATGHMATWGLKTRAITGNVTALATWLQQLATVGIVYFGVLLISAGRMNMGALIAIMMLSGRAIAPFMQLALLGTRYYQARSAFMVINRLMGAPEEQGKQMAYRRVKKFHGNIELKQLSFSYTDSVIPALSGISVAINSGEKVAVVGRSGSGKSTLARILAALYQPDQGQVFLDSIAQGDIHPATLRAKIGFLPQDPWLFHGSVMDNITMGTSSFSEEDLLTTARDCGVTFFTGDSLAALEYPVGEGGRQLSGGQRRAVALARAMLSKPDILILDEPSAHMDSLMDARVQKTLKSLPENVTLIIITHRSSLLSIVDRVIMLDGGKLVSDQPVHSREPQA